MESNSMILPLRFGNLPIQVNMDDQDHLLPVYIPPQHPRISHTHFTRQQEICTPTTTPPPLPEPPSMSAKMVVNNQDLLTEIFLYLPPKSLLRFQSVSKKWHSIISSPKFRRLHSRQRRSDAFPGIILCRVFRSLPECSFICPSNDAREIPPMRVVASNLSNRLEGRQWRVHSCNGLFCLDPDEKVASDFLVYNPTTNQFRSIPLPNSPETGYSSRALHLAFDPSQSDHYKIVCLWMILATATLRFSIYSSETWDWKLSDECIDFGNRFDAELQHDRRYASLLHNFHVLLKCGVYLNGAVHWVCSLGDFWLFDLCSERIIPIPGTSISGTASLERNIQYFGESDGRLLVIQSYEAHWSPVALGTLVDVFRMERDYSKWSLIYRVDLEFLMTKYPFMEYDESGLRIYKFRIPCVLMNDKEKVAKLVIALPGKLISYSLLENKIVEHVQINFREVRLLKSHLSLYSWVDAHKYLETLACV